MPLRPEISHTDARHIIDAIADEMDARKVGAAVAVVDPHGELVAFLRSDGCRLPSINIAVNKAYSAARERTESAALGDSSREEGFPMTNFGDLRYVGWGGGLPIIVGGDVVGAVGVSGLTTEEDLELARIGLAQISG